MKGAVKKPGAFKRWAETDDVPEGVKGAAAKAEIGSKVDIIPGPGKKMKTVTSLVKKRAVLAKTFAKFRKKTK